MNIKFLLDAEGGFTCGDVSLDNPGFCLCCGEEAMGVEPDATRYTCESCEAPAVYGAEELLIWLADF